MAKSRAYHKLSLKAKLRRRLGWFKNIANAANGLQPGFAGIDFGAQAVNEHIDDVGLRVKTIVENMLEDHRLGHGPAGVAHEIFKQRKLAGLQIDFLAGAHDLAIEQVKGQIADGQAGRLGGLGGAANQGLQARGQFGKGEGFGQVIIAAGLQAFDAIVHRGFGAEKNDRGADFSAAHALDEAEAVELGHHNIYDSGIEGGRLGQQKSLLAVGTAIDGIARLLQPFDHKGSNLVVVLNHQNAHFVGHTSSAWTASKRECGGNRESEKSKNLSRPL